MPTKLYIKKEAIYEASKKRLQTDIELEGASITKAHNQITAIAFEGVGVEGASGTFTDKDDNVITVENGLITEITAPE